MLQLYHYIG